jgi:hypothetical protein
MQNPSSLRDFYPTLTEEQLKEAEANLRRYAQVTLEICQEEFSAGGFDSPHASTTMKERSSFLKN